MPLYVTDGTTSRQHRSGVVWAEGKVTSATSYVDMRYDTARTAGFGYFRLDLTGMRFESKQLALWGLSSAGTTITTGYFGGYYAHGENDADLDAGTSDRMSSTQFFRISADRNGEHAGRYLGNFTVHITYPVDSTIIGANGARPNVYWHGTCRVCSILASSIAGGGVCTGSADYGIRIGTHDGSNNWTLGSYCLTAFKEGGEF